jgi:hypothetical protein
MITLPPVEHACLKGFMVIIGILIGVSLGISLSLLGVGRPFGWGALVALLLILSGYLAPRFARLVYRVWNRAALEFARYASVLLIGICFYVVMVAVGKTGSTLKLARLGSTESMWVPRNTLAANSYRHQHALDFGESTHRSWISSFSSWAFRSGNFWSCFLLPFLIVLPTFDVPRNEAVPTDIYTLY